MLSLASVPQEKPKHSKSSSFLIVIHKSILAGQAEFSTFQVDILVRRIKHQNTYTFIYIYIYDINASRDAQSVMGQYS